MVRINFDVKPEVHKYIKAQAVMEGKNIKEYVLDKLLDDNKDIKQLSAETKKAIDDIEAGIKLNKFKNADDLIDAL